MAGQRLAIRVTNDEALRRTLADFGDSLGDWTEIHARTARTVATAARAMAPRKSGHLAGSIEPRASRFKASIVSALIYAPVQHWGWPAHHIEGHPFVTDAARRTEPVWLRYYLDELDDQCTDVARACPRGRA